jgi:hypothetical protein
VLHAGHKLPITHEAKHEARLQLVLSVAFSAQFSVADSIKPFSNISAAFAQPMGRNMVFNLTGAVVSLSASGGTSARGALLELYSLRGQLLNASVSFAGFDFCVDRQNRQ